MPRIRSIAHITGVEATANRISSGRKRNKRIKVACYCSNCNGKLVLSRTKIFYESGRNVPPVIQLPNEPPEIPDVTPEIPDETPEIPAEIPDVQVIIDESEEGESSTTSRRHNERQITEDNPERNFLPRRRIVRRTIYHPPELHGIGPDESAIYNTSDSTSNSSSDQESNNESTAEVFEDYSSPPYQDDPDIEEETTINDRFSWILLWIMMFRIKFNISETATESLIKFMKLVLTEIGDNTFSEFPDSLYLARKVLGLKDHFHLFVPCPKCHKLYRKQEVEQFQQNGSTAVMNCRHVEFPNSSLRMGRFCNTPLSRKMGTKI